jgi:hypothetical protein
LDFWLQQTNIADEQLFTFECEQWRRGPTA